MLFSVFCICVFFVMFFYLFCACVFYFSIFQCTYCLHLTCFFSFACLWCTCMFIIVINLRFGVHTFLPLISTFYHFNHVKGVIWNNMYFLLINIMESYKYSHILFFFYYSWNINITHLSIYMFYIIIFITMYLYFVNANRLT